MRVMLAIAGLAILVAQVGVAQTPSRAVVDGTVAPHARPKLSGGIEIFNVDLAEALTKQLERPIMADTAQSSGLIPSLQAGPYVFLIAPTTLTKESAENNLLPGGDLNTDFQFLTKQGVSAWP